jgi:glycine oxidase
VRDDWAELLVAAARDYPASIAALQEASGLDPEFRRIGLLRAVVDEAEVESIRTRRELLRDLGVAAEWLEADDLRRFDPLLGPEVLAGLWLPDGAAIRGDRLTRAYARAAALAGADLREGSPVLRLARDGERVIGVETAAGRIAAERVVLAAGSWSGPLSGELPQPLPVRPVKGQSLVARAPRGWLGCIVTGAWATLLPRQDGELYLGATIEEAGFDERPTLGALAGRVREAARLRPGVEVFHFEAVRTGLRPAGPTPVPIVGPVPGSPGLIAATAHYRLGVLLAPMTGRVVAEMVVSGGAGSEEAGLFRRAGALMDDI